MQARGLAKNLIMTPLAQYEPADWNGKNESGMLPIGDYVLLVPDKAPEQSGGGVLFTDQKRDIDGQAAETGVLVAAGENAWKWNADRSRPFDGTKPQVGQRVWFERYAGFTHHGKDGVAYRLLIDKCISAVATD